MNVLGSRLFGAIIGKNITSQFPRYFSSAVSSVNNEIDKLVKSSKVVIFMKGNPEQPRCGFSNAVVQILRMHGVSYDAHDVLQRDDLRNGMSMLTNFFPSTLRTYLLFRITGIKEYSNWPTIPQVFINGEFVGGCDIMLQLHQTGNLVTELKKAGIKSALADAVTGDEKKNESA